MTTESSAVNGLGLYIHLPWCVQKCPYCDFNSHALKQTLPEQDYLEALLADINFEASQWGKQRISTIFFGGGTPSLFSDTSIGRLIEHVGHYFELDRAAEITLEANPGTADSDYLAGYRQVGVNRLSLGFQSLDDGQLAGLGRIHRAAEAIQAYQMARDAGFENINIDLMFGLPQQTRQMALNDLQQVIDLQPEHISWYQLTIEPNTAFAYSPPALPESDDIFEMQEAGIAMLQDKGYLRYEVSAFARYNQHCRHNLNYWQFGDYLGIGAGAHSKLTQESSWRYARQRHPKQYLASAGSAEVYQLAEPIPSNALLFEFLLNRLRLPTEIPLHELAPYMGDEPDRLEKVLGKAIQRELLMLTDQGLWTTAQGFRFLDEILVGLLPEAEY